MLAAMATTRRADLVTADSERSDDITGDGARHQRGSEGGLISLREVPVGTISHGCHSPQ